MKQLFRILVTYVLAGIAGFALYVLSFGFGIGGEILFYRGLLLAAGTAIVLAVLLTIAARRWRIDLATGIGAVFASLAFNVCFLVLIPVTIDRSISVFLLSRIEANPGVTTADLERRFEGDYIEGMQQIPRRVREQTISGNISVGRDGVISLTPNGKRFNAFARAAAGWFGTDKRFVEVQPGEGKRP